MRSFFVLCVWTGLIATTKAVSLYPYGAGEGDTLMTRSDDGSEWVPLSCSFGFYGNQYNGVWINDNGHLTFDNSRFQYWPPTVPFSDNSYGDIMIAPYYVDVDYRWYGSIYYRETQNAAFMTTLKTDIGCPGFTPSCAFVVSWIDADRYFSYGGPMQYRNTFQVVLVTDGTHTFALFKYIDITFADGDASEEEWSMAGFNAGDGVLSWQHPDSYTPSIVNIETTSNVNDPGVWCFKIDQDIMDDPSTYCPALGCVTTVTPSGADGECTCDFSCECTLECPPRANCSVGVGAPNQVNTYDGDVDYMTSGNKFLISSYKPGTDDQCSYRVRVDSDDDGNGFIDVAFTGVGFGVHLGNPFDDDYDRNFRVFKGSNAAEIRGRGFSSPQDVAGDSCWQTLPTVDYPSVWFFCVSYPDAPTNRIVHITGSVPDQDCWFWVTVIQPGAPGNPYSHEIVLTSSSPYYDGKLIGMCGDRDGDASNDDQFCYGPPIEFPGGHECIDGEHQYNQG